MLDSIPVPLQVIIWPLIGTILILVGGRFLPNLLQRAVALIASLASLSALWSMRAGGATRVVIYWEPLNFFRMSPTLQPSGLALFASLSLTTLVALATLGIRGSDSRRTRWHGLILWLLAGCVLTTMAGDLLTLALGSGLIDLALIALVITSADGADRAVWRIVVPSMASTLLLFLSAVRADVLGGSASLQAHDFPTESLVLMGIAGVLRLLVFPLHPRGLKTPENGICLLLSVGTGIYLLARVQATGPVLDQQPWLLALGGTGLLVGGFLAWAGSTRSSDPAKSWPAIATHQAGYALLFVLLLHTSVPWPLFSLVLALGALAIWWDGNGEKEAPAWPAWFEQFVERIEPWRARARSAVRARMSILDSDRASSLARVTTAALPAVALASLAGGPLTVGITARWPFYATLLRKGEATLLIATLAGDTLLAAALWAAIALSWRQAKTRRLRMSSFLAIMALDLGLIVLGLAPDKFAVSLGLKPFVKPDVSAWGLGLLFVLPWLLGAWLARVGSRMGRSLVVGRRIAQLDWLYNGVSRLGRGLTSIVFWVGLVGEGDGWWGWALIILALGTMFLTMQ
jgi:hypothetical protein